MKLKTIPYVKTRVLQSKQLLDSALQNTRYYTQLTLQYQSQQQQGKQLMSKIVRPQYSQQGVRQTTSVDAKAVEKINRLASRITVILDEIMILLKSKDNAAIYSKLGAILFYLDFILDPFLRIPAIAKNSTWVSVPVKKLTTHPLKDSFMASSLSAMMSAVAPPVTAPFSFPSFSLLKAQDAQSVLPVRKRGRVQQQQQLIYHI